jgi:hypothetical protein
MKKFVFAVLFSLVPCVLANAVIPSPKTVNLYGLGDFLTIQSAIDDSGTVDGSVVICDPGTYTGTGNRDIDFKGKSITLKSTNPDDPAVVAATVINCQGSSVQPHSGFVCKTGEGSGPLAAQLQGFTITNAYTATNGSAVNCTYNSTLGKGVSLVISKCVFKNNTSQFDGGAIIINKQCSLQITNCTFIQNAVLNSARGGGAIMSYDHSNITIFNSLFGGNSAYRGGAVYAQKYSSISLNNCTLAYNKTTGKGGGAAAYDNSTITGKNTIVWGNTTSATPKQGDALSAESTSVLSFIYSDFPDPADAANVYVQAGSTPIDPDQAVTKNIYDDPKFFDADGLDGDINTWKDNDLRPTPLMPLSPCIDAGNPSGDYTGQKDLDGHSRVIHGTVDMGCYETLFGSLKVLFDPTTITAAIQIDTAPAGPAPVVPVQLPIGDHMVTFGPVTDYADTYPNPKVVRVVEDPQISDPSQAPVLTNVTGKYVKLQAILGISTTPVNGSVTVDGVPWGIAPISKLVDVGSSYTITFGPVADYETPAPQTGIVTTSGLAVMGTYVHETGTIAIDTTSSDSPPNPPVKGEVFVDGVSQGLAPVAPITLVTGPHNISFGAVDGYTKPIMPPVTVVKGANPPLTGTYIPLPPDIGTLSIDTTGTKGEVFLNGGSLGTAPQSINLGLGTYTVSFANVPGYDKPADQTAVIGKNQTTQIIGAYIQQTGNLTVGTTPVVGEVFVNGVSWGTSALGKQVPVGDYTVTFGDVAGYTKPAAQTVTVAKNDLKVVNGVYIPPSTVPSGTLTIGTTPVLGEVFVDGLSWGSAPQSKSLPTGNHTITFGAMAGYVGPNEQNVAIVKDQASNITGTYVQLSPTKYHLIVEIQGQGTVQSGTGDYDMDTQVSLLAAPSEYWVFDSWQGDLTGTDNPGNLKMTGNKTVKAVFREATPQINSIGDWLRVLCLPFAGFTIAGIFLGGSLLGRKSY